MGDSGWAISAGRSALGKVYGGPDSPVETFGDSGELFEPENGEGHLGKLWTEDTL
jgi:hypothetical protein